MTAAQKFIDRVFADESLDLWFHPEEYDETIWNDLDKAVRDGLLLVYYRNVVPVDPGLGRIAFFRKAA